MSRDYEQYYIGNKDEENRKNGNGENHWSGPKSLECYEGHFIRDTMHGAGEYYWKLRGPENAFVTYEGYFYSNQIHGYGTMSYPNGITFNGLFIKNIRWGPGIERHANLRENVGLWRGHQLVRLIWQPPAPNVIPDFISIHSGKTIVESHRITLTSQVETVGQINSALDLLKKFDANPIVASIIWSKVYPKHCTDIHSPLCHVDFLKYNYYNGKIYSLRETNEISDDKNENANEEFVTYYTWNNNSTIINMMKHAYRHDNQRNSIELDLRTILSGPRSYFKLPGLHELQCRIMLMACYLGHIAVVAELINKYNVHPDVSDGQGNCAIMYAVCGDQTDIIHFLIEAGANVDFYNDNCCTPLAIALLQYTCAENDIAPSEILNAVLPPVTTAPTLNEQKVLEWNLIRGQLSTNIGNSLTRSPSKQTNRNLSSKKIKSSLSLHQSTSKKKSESLFKIDGPFTEELKLYNDITQEYCIKVTDSIVYPNNTTTVPYLFHVNDMVREIEANEEDQKKQSEKNPKKISSKIIKETIKTSKEVLCDSKDKERQSIDSAEKLKVARLSKIMLTILQLLLDGADPKSVRCPHPALLIAATCNCPDLIRHLLHYGADVHDTYQQCFHYTCLDVIVSRPFTQSNLEMASALLENSADAGHRLAYKQETKDPTSPYDNIQGPTLLHIILGRKTENNHEEDIRLQLLGLLLDHNCNPATLFKGRSAIDIAMTKTMELFDLFIKHSKANLNAIINDSNQSILVKMFSIPFFRNYGRTERLQMLTNLLLFGADPLNECQDGEEVYENIFVYNKQTLSEMDNVHSKAISQPIGKQDLKGKKSDKQKKDEKLSNKSMGKMTVDELEDYRLCINIVADCARLIYVRWLQTKLTKELLEVINKYKHRYWSMILKELNTNVYGLWLTPLRCLEIWDVLANSKLKACNDKGNLRHLLCIVIYISWKNYGQNNARKVLDQSVTASLRDMIESDVAHLLKQHIIKRKQKSDLKIGVLPFSYITPGLLTDAKKFNVCFECIQPLREDKILCSWCKLISFCSVECIKVNLNREDCHPCSNFLRMTYFSSPEENMS